MKNTYHVLRHGESKANTAGIILSHAEHGKSDAYTLTENGEQQVRTSVKAAMCAGTLDASTVIYASPFSRCRRTAEIAREELGAEDIHFDKRLRERWFGELEGQSNAHYPSVWQHDKSNAEHTEFNVESAADVQKRGMAVIADLEKTYQNRVILLVSHGDTLQILQTGVANTSPSAHRDMEPLTTAEIRELA